MLKGVKRKMIVEQAIKIIEKMDGVLDVQELPNENRDALMKVESSREKDIIPVVNKGLKECLKRDFCLVMLKTGKFRFPPEPTVLLVTDNGKVMGQEIISPEDRKKFNKQDDAYFLSRDFVIFKPSRNTMNLHNDKELFLLPSIPFPELNNIEGISDVVSCSPSTLGDAYLKNKYGYPEDPHIATILVGFSLKNKSGEV